MLHKWKVEAVRFFEKISCLPAVKSIFSIIHRISISNIFLAVFWVILLAPVLLVSPIILIFVLEFLFDVSLTIDDVCIFFEAMFCLSILIDDVFVLLGLFCDISYTNGDAIFALFEVLFDATLFFQDISFFVLILTIECSDIWLDFYTAYVYVLSFLFFEINCDIIFMIDDWFDSMFYCLGFILNIFFLEYSCLISLTFNMWDMFYYDVFEIDFLVFDLVYFFLGCFTIVYAFIFFPIELFFSISAFFFKKNVWNSYDAHSNYLDKSVNTDGEDFISFLNDTVEMLEQDKFFLFDSIYFFIEFSAGLLLGFFSFYLLLKIIRYFKNK